MSNSPTESLLDHCCAPAALVAVAGKTLDFSRQTTSPPDPTPIAGKVDVT
jgi:hypothetical protein